MDSTLPRRALRALGALLAAAACLPAAALNHDQVASPITTARFNVACSNVEHDTARMASLGGNPADYWEGREVNGATRYVTEVLAQPDTAVIFQATSPFKIGMYPQTFGRRTTFAAIVCFPTPATNADPSYALPGGAGVIPHMQRAGQAPQIVSDVEYAQRLGLAVPPGPGEAKKLPLIVYSHGLGGSPVGPGYLDVALALASQGFMVAGVFHADNRFSKVRIEDLADLAYALLFFPLVLEMQAMRPLSLKAMTDTLLADGRWNRGIDQTRIGGFGASLGGQAMAHLLGADITASIGKSCDEPVHDPRVRAAVGYVPYSGQTFLPAFCGGQEGASRVDRPYLAMSGTDDTTAPLGMTRQAVNRFQSSRYLVELQGGKHELRPQDAPDVVTWTVTFLNAYLDLPHDNAMARLARMASVNGGAVDRLTIDVHVPNASVPRAVEFLQSDTGRFGWALGESEAAARASQPGWEFARHALRVPATSASSDTPIPVCRTVRQGVPVLAVGEVECGVAARARGGSGTATAFYAAALQNGACPPAWLQLMRVRPPLPSLLGPPPFDRLTTSDSTVGDMVRMGWVALGPVACVPA